MNTYVKKLFSLNDFCTHYMYMVDVWLETKAVGGFFEWEQNFPQYVCTRQSIE